MRILCFLLIFIIVNFQTTFAVEPPHLSEELKSKAEDVLKVEVLHVEKQDFSHKGYIEIYVKTRLKILTVRRTRNELKYNYQINFNYLHRYKLGNDGMAAPGPSILPIIETSQILTVYLNRVEGMRNTYKPAALGKSFQF